MQRRSRLEPLERLRERRSRELGTPLLFECAKVFVNRCKRVLAVAGFEGLEALWAHDLV